MKFVNPDAKFGGGGWMTGLTMALGGLLFAVLMVAAKRQDDVTHELRRSQVESALEAIKADYGRIARDYGWWDEAHDRLVLNHDPGWADANIGEWLDRTTGAAFSFALDGDGQALFTYPHLSVSGVEGLGYLTDAALAASSDLGAPVTSYLRRGQRLVLASASVLRHSTPDGQDSRAVLVIAWDMENTVLPRLRNIIQLKDLTLTAQGTDTLDLARSDGEVLGTLHWTPEQPGKPFLRTVLPAAGIVFLILTAVAWRQWYLACGHWRQLKAVDAMRTRLLAAIGHDLRQPLQSLALFAGVLDGQCNGPHAGAALTNLNQSLQRMGRLLDANLRLARMDLTSERLKTQAIDLNQVVADVCMEMRPQAEVRGLELRSVGTCARVWSEPVLLASIVRNLLSNAIRYTDKGRILVGARRRHDKVELWVCDTGIGIAPEKLDLVFEEFYQADGTCCDSNKGVGLGLAIVRRLAKLLEHKVDVRSQLGRGTVFSVTMRSVESRHPT